MHKKGKQVLSEMYKNTSVFLRIDKYKKAEHRTKSESSFPENIWLSMVISEQLDDP